MFQHTAFKLRICAYMFAVVSVIKCLVTQYQQIMIFHQSFTLYNIAALMKSVVFIAVVTCLIMMMSRLVCYFEKRKEE